ncbi:MAG TPA: diguanylate cyclase [Acidimicrobiales bacterium]|nr:diguanylate cyclase [Acidimicrobiales bacterium]
MTDDKRARNRPAIPTILVVDDSTSLRRFICRTLAAAGYRVVVAADGCAVLEACRSDRPDLVLLDIDMPVMDGHATLREMRADADLCSVPVLFLTTDSGGSDVASRLALGAQDCLRTPCEPDQLIARVATTLRNKAAEDALALQARQMSDLSTFDVLTGLANRQHMETRILELAARQGPYAVASVVMVEIDDFMAISDTLGHAVGDMILRIVAGRLRGAVVDDRVLVSRWGGEGFLAAGVGLDAKEAYVLAEQLRHAVSVTPFAIGVDQAIPVTVSAGCATGTLGVYAAVLEAADGALLEAKRAGRNRTVVASHVQPVPTGSRTQGPHEGRAR